MSAAEVTYWDSMTFRDAAAMTVWLEAIGFTEHATHRDESDPAIVVQAEWLWPGGGGLMFGTQRDDGIGAATPGTSAVYLVVDDPDAVFDRAVAGGASVVQAMVDQDYGGRGGTVRDPEGNMWSFGN